MTMRSKGINTVWTRGVSDKEKEAVERLVQTSTTILLALKDIWERERQYLLSMQSKEETYDDASWAFKQAHYNGRLEQLKRNLELLSHLED